jgi:hypothetical protein
LIGMSGLSAPAWGASNAEGPIKYSIWRNRRAYSPPFADAPKG